MLPSVPVGKDLTLMFLLAGYLAIGFVTGCVWSKYSGPKAIPLSMLAWPYISYRLGKASLKDRAYRKRLKEADPAFLEGIDESK